MVLAVVTLTLTASTAHARIPPCSEGTTTIRASWYGKPFHGRLMANGKRYNMYDATTVAHLTLPFRTKVRFWNPQNGKKTTARVKDRGPKKTTGRAFDLSYQLSHDLGTTQKGVASLVVCIVK